jgi:hypothetical protein
VAGTSAQFVDELERGLGDRYQDAPKLAARLRELEVALLEATLRRHQVGLQTRFLALTSKEQEAIGRMVALYPFAASDVSVSDKQLGAGLVAARAVADHLKALQNVRGFGLATAAHTWVGDVERLAGVFLDASGVLTPLQANLRVQTAGAVSDLRWVIGRGPQLGDTSATPWTMGNDPISVTFKVQDSVLAASNAKSTVKRVNPLTLKDLAGNVPRLDDQTKVMRLDWWGLKRLVGVSRIERSTDEQSLTCRFPIRDLDEKHLFALLMDFDSPDKAMLFTGEWPKANQYAWPTPLWERP